MRGYFDLFLACYLDLYCFPVTYFRGLPEGPGRSVLFNDFVYSSGAGRQVREDCASSFGVHFPPRASGASRVPDRHAVVKVYYHSLHAEHLIVLLKSFVLFD